MLGRALQGAGVRGESSTGIGVFGKGKLAGHFQGDVRVTGALLHDGADCAEDFEILEHESVDNGSVVVITDGGAMKISSDPYDKKVAGVISGAGKLQPGIVMDNRVTQVNRKPVALTGKVFCKVDATYNPVRTGDLLTTSSTPGHAMVASEPALAFGAVIGKALGELVGGRGLVPILISLQ